MSEQFEMVPGNSLITKTPEEGRQLAVKMARLVNQVLVNLLFS